jgi:hypothetical protein
MHQNTTSKATPTTFGPNERALVFQKFCTDAIPDGGGFTDGLRALMDKGMPVKMTGATAWVKEALDILMDTVDCPYKTREEAAKAVLEKIKG